LGAKTAEGEGLVPAAYVEDIRALVDHEVKKGDIRPRTVLHCERRSNKDKFEESTNIGLDWPLDNAMQGQQSLTRLEEGLLQGIHQRDRCEDSKMRRHEMFLECALPVKRPRTLRQRWVVPSFVRERLLYCRPFVVMLKQTDTPTPTAAKPFTLWPMKDKLSLQDLSRRPITSRMIF
jgi:hypothetical protein